MNESTFEAWQDATLAAYAADKRRSGAWGEDALDRARSEHGRVLPRGLATADNHIFSIRDAREGTAVGSLRNGLCARGAPRAKAWAFDVLVHELLFS